jgi:hypothetical protein
MLNFKRSKMSPRAVHERPEIGDVGRESRKDIIRKDAEQRFQAFEVRMKKKQPEEKGDPRLGSKVPQSRVP